MQNSSSVQNDSPQLPYSKWAQHRAENGLIYLSHPVTGHVKWLWSRHHDPKTSNDYLVNTVTGKRHWVTKQNAHLCPIVSKPDQTNNQATNTKPNLTSLKPSQLSADEVLMVVPKTGRRYIFNTTTKTSRWLNQSVSDLPENTPPQTSIPGRDANANSVPNNPQVTQGPVQGILHHASARAVRRDVRSAPVFQNTTSVTEPNAIDASQSNNVHLPNSDPSFKKVRPIIPPIKATRNENGSLALPNHAESESTDAQNVSGKLQTLNTMLRDIKLLTTSGKYDMSYFRTLQKKDTVQVENNREDSQRLLELEEHLTQQMLKVDAVESDGNQIVRAKRKETVKTILALSEEIEDLRKKLACL